MRQYQETYIQNLKKIAALAELSGDIPLDVDRFLAEREKKQEEIDRLRYENTELLRQYLMPVLDNIISADEAEVNELAEFALQLAPGVKQLDLVLTYDIHNALIAYARKWELRDMLIRELYLCGMSLYYMQNFMARAGKRLYSVKIRMLFGEAASWLPHYDEIADPQTRGYIHRSMANLTLGDGWESEENGRRKIRAMRRSLQVLTDPVYQEKTPSLPWDTFIYKSHQSRMTAIDFMRRGFGDQELVREIMESAEYVRERQLKDSQNRGIEPDMRWTVEYEAVLYHCGIRTLPELLLGLEKFYMKRNPLDYSQDGIWQNIYLPGLYAEYLSFEEDFRIKKKEVLGHMYRMVVRYVRNAPNNQLNAQLLHTLIAILESFQEYPDGISQKDFLLNLVACRNPDSYAFQYMTGMVSGILMEEAVRKMPEAFVGVLGCASREQAQQSVGELTAFARESGMLHDIGAILFSDMVTLAGRSLMKEERIMYAHHVYAGRLMLSRCDSTRPYAMTALGHHRYYDEKGGYPEDYVRSDNPNQAVTDLVSIAVYLTSYVSEREKMQNSVLSLAQAVVYAQRDGGKRFHPEFVKLLPGVLNRLSDCFTDGKRKAYQKALSLLRREEI